MATKWLEKWLTQASSGNGDPTRRAKSDVDTQSSLAELTTEAQARGWHVLDTGDHYVLIPTGKMQVIC